MIEALLIRLGLGVIASYWKPLAVAGAIAAVIGAFAWLWIANENKAAALATSEASIATAVDANKAQGIVLAQMVKEQDADRELVKAQAARSEAIATDTSALKKEFHNAPQASGVAGPYFDDLGDRLRALDARGY